MCGIGGILRADGQPIPEEWLDAIDERIKWRGPDGSGRFRDRVVIDESGVVEPAPPQARTPAPPTPVSSGKRVIEVAFVHRRLSIIDHADGAQPMVSERGRDESEGLVAVVFNGCIYNHHDLRRELEGKGHRFVTDHSDTEVLIHGWREWGSKLPEHLEGMYAFAVWDRSQPALFLARDEYGEKPLYKFARGASGGGSPSVAFASTLTPLVRSPFSPNDWSQHDPQHVGRFLQRGYGWANVVPYISDVPERNQVDVQHEGMNSDIDEIRPGTWRRWHREGMTIAGATTFPDERKSTSLEEFERLIDQAVSRRLEADAPLGCFLSGGVDSSLLAQFAMAHTGRLRTFCIRMPERRYDESVHAETVARHLKTAHVTLDADPHPAQDLIHLIEILGQPFGDSSILPTYWVSRAARQYIKVSLSGDGGDEMFCGYERHRIAGWLARYNRLLAMLPSSVVGWRASPKTLRGKIARLTRIARDYQRSGIAALTTIFSAEELDALIGAEFTKDMMASDPRLWSRPGLEAFAYVLHFKLHIENELKSSRDSGSILQKTKEFERKTGDLDLSAETPAEHLRRIDVLSYLPGDLLRKVDTASMAAGLEVRCPFLDRDLATAALAMPADQLMPGGQRKGLLRNIARKHLPKEIVDRPKMGFAIPISEWFRTDYGQMKTLLLDHLESTAPFGEIQLNRKAVRRYIDEHMSGKRDHGHKLFTLLTLSIWARGRKP